MASGELVHAGSSGAANRGRNHRAMADGSVGGGLGGLGCEHTKAGVQKEEAVFWLVRKGVRWAPETKLVDGRQSDAGHGEVHGDAPHGRRRHLSLHHPLRRLNLFVPRNHCMSTLLAVKGLLRQLGPDAYQCYTLQPSRHHFKFQDIKELELP